MEGDLLRINKWLLPLSWLYGAGVALRNTLFDIGVLKSYSYNIPIINIGNLTVGGTGKTPHTEYIIRLLSQSHKVAVLSRGYKRKSSGYVLATMDSTVEEIGDEPWQMKQKFPNIYVAVDKNRRGGIERLCSDEETRDVEVILLDDAYQHRYVQPGLNILLVDSHRMITEDRLLPAGRLREPRGNTNRADIVIVTKCPTDITPMEFHVLQKKLGLMPFQSLFFSTFHYGQMYSLSGKNSQSLNDLHPQENILLLTGIASPEQMKLDLEAHTSHITPLPFPDHHFFTADDASLINRTFASLPSPKSIITTEKDAPRLKLLPGLSEEVKAALYVLPVEVDIIRKEKQNFNDKITGYVFQNPRNRNVAQDHHENESHNRHHPWHRSGTFS